MLRAGPSRQRVRRVGGGVSLTSDHASCGPGRQRVRGGCAPLTSYHAALGLLSLYYNDYLCRKEHLRSNESGHKKRWRYQGNNK